MQATIRIKGFDRIEQIALGRRAVLFRAREREHDRPVVFKLLLPHLAEDPRFVKRLKREVPMAVEIRHENLVNILQFGRAADTVFVAFEEYRGRRLETLLSGCPRLPIDIALHVVLAVAHALEACHQHRLIHRDVRPHNIVLTRGGGVKLDNLTMATNVPGANHVDFAGRVSTTLAYMSPEQIKGENLSAQSDIFSLGVVAWELCCGKGAFGLGSGDDIAERVETTVLPRVSDVNPTVAPAFGEIVERMLEKDRTRRYASASELIADLRTAIRNHGHKLDAKAVVCFVEDPAAYTDAQRKASVEALIAETAHPAGSDPVTLIRHYEKLVYLQPANTEARRELTRLKLLANQAKETGTSPGVSYVDPTMTYRVILESLDTSRETRASFAVKLATKLRVPLPAVRRYVEDMPAALPGEHPYRKAVFLAGVMEEIGAVTRVEASRQQRKEAMECPECGAPAEADAELCSFCQHRFVPCVDLHAGFGDEEPDPLDVRECPPGLSSSLAFFTALPMRTKVLAVSLIVLLVVLLLTAGP